MLRFVCCCERFDRPHESLMVRFGLSLVMCCCALCDVELCDVKLYLCEVYCCAAV
jgi:hypothetical protein